MLPLFAAVAGLQPVVCSCGGYLLDGWQELYAGIPTGLELQGGEGPCRSVI